MDIFSFFAKPALESQVLQEAPPQAAQESAIPLTSLLASEHGRLQIADALEELASLPSWGQLRISQKDARRLLRFACVISLDEQGRAA